MLGLEVVERPLFAVQPLTWRAPDPAAFDALLLTSANAARLAGTGLDRLLTLPAHCVGGTTAEAARAAGLTIGIVGKRGIDALLAALPGRLRLLHLVGANHAVPLAAAHRVTAIAVYAAGLVDNPDLPALDGLVVAVHSPRAGRRLDSLARGREGAKVAAISREAADACGAGWDEVAIAERPDDGALLALAARLCQAMGR